MRFTELLPHIQDTYPGRTRRFHIIATRYYVGAESLEDLRSHLYDQPVYKHKLAPALLSFEEYKTIILGR